jgi:hypothetical protein
LPDAGLGTGARAIENQAGNDAKAGFHAKTEPLHRDLFLDRKSERSVGRRPDLRYLLKNLKDGGASGFRNDVLFNDQLVSQQTNLSVGAAVSSVPVWTQMYLPIQEGVLKIKIDAGNQVDEEWEGDNEVWLHVKFAGF